LAFQIKITSLIRVRDKPPGDSAAVAAYRKKWGEGGSREGREGR